MSRLTVDKDKKQIKDYDSIENIGDIQLKLLGPGGEPIHGGYGTWPLPTINEDGTVVSAVNEALEGSIRVCDNGYHLTSGNTLYYWITPDKSSECIHFYEGEPYKCDVHNDADYAAEKVAYRQVELVNFLGVLTPNAAARTYLSWFSKKGLKDSTPEHEYNVSLDEEFKELCNKLYSLIDDTYKGLNPEHELIQSLKDYAGRVLRYTTLGQHIRLLWFIITNQYSVRSFASDIPLRDYPESILPILFSNLETHSKTEYVRKYPQYAYDSISFLKDGVDEDEAYDEDE